MIVKALALTVAVVAGIAVVAPRPSSMGEPFPPPPSEPRALWKDRQARCLASFEIVDRGGLDIDRLVASAWADATAHAWRAYFAAHPTRASGEPRPCRDRARDFMP